MSLLVGLTGGMGAGKSLVAQMLKECGAYIIDADQICFDLVKPDKPAWVEIIDNFGPEILLEDRTVNRTKLGKIIFQDHSKKTTLEHILHPKVMDEERRIYDAIRKDNPDAIVMLDAALLIESGNYRNVDKVVVVGCEEAIQIRRLLVRGKWSEEEIIGRLKAQMKLDEKVKFADYVIVNDSTIDQLRSKVAGLYSELASLL